jgi:hypothetical protein
MRQMFSCPLVFCGCNSVADMKRAWPCLSSALLALPAAAARSQITAQDHPSSAPSDVAVSIPLSAVAERDLNINDNEDRQCEADELR